ncbi:hypothetical protein [Candidatus Burkholderia verschuerenii]|uniref:hypothetical protein n=1 Tax=Candidatus Burkholderia verschuerenii TaxID=242163 RepID=UPI002FC3E045
MLRVRPAQWITMVVSGAPAKASICAASSPFGTQTAPGIAIRRCSSRVRPSISASGQPPRSARHRCNCAALTCGVPYSCSTSSPKVFDATLTPRNSVKPASRHACTPPSRIEISP